jgi:hypothetical protein
VVTNQYGTYNGQSTVQYAVSNVFSSTNEPLSTDGNTLETQLRDAIDGALSIAPILTINEPSPLQGRVEFDVLAADASRVRIYAVADKSNALHSLGSAIKHSDTSWRYTWSSTNLPDGSYTFYAKIYTADTTLETNKIEKSIKNTNDGVVLISDVSTAVQTETSDASTEQADVSLAPNISLSLSKTSPLSGFVEVNVVSKDTTSVEIFAIPENSLREQFIARAFMVSSDTWKTAWDTSNVPNGEYKLFARSKNKYGSVESDTQTIVIRNQIVTTFTPEQEEAIDVIQKVSNSLITEVSDASEIPQDDTDTTSNEYAPLVYIQAPHVFVDTIYSSDDTYDIDEKSEVEHVLRTYRENLNVLLNDYARALRTEDVESARAVKTQIESLKNAVITNLPNTVAQKALIDSINTYLSQITFELQELTEKNEKIIKERMGSAVSTDSDMDGITDYDEVHLYKTNPFAADTDGDGYIDSAEITLGLDPNNSDTQAYMVYESAKDSGIIREDVFYIESITTLESDDSEHSSPRALITGKGLPNSFVNLYIYSTPIIVTVKTDTDGSWSYIFDKELEDGEHEVYVGITDNAGSIVAKSTPFPFVKTAEAFAQTNPLESAAFANLTPSFISTNMMILVASLAIVALGLVLLLLGLHVSNRKLPEPIEFSS